MLENDRYNTVNISVLEAFVSNQVSEDSYNLDANLALLKFYQFQPAKAKLDMVTKVLVKALMQLPGSDFQLCLYLLPDTIMQAEAVNNLMMLANHLESCDFAQFWESAAQMDDVLQVVPGFATAIRKFIMITLSISYARVPKTDLCSALNLKLKDLKNVPGAEEFYEFDAASDTVQFIENEQNRFKPKPSEQLEDYATVFSKVLYSSAITSSV